MRYLPQCMRFAFCSSPGGLPLFWRAALASGLLGLAGCTADAGDALGSRVPTGGVSGPDAAVRFDDDATVALAPGSVHTLTVTGSPPANYEMSFTLLGDALDATLDRTTVVADAQGHASVELRA